MSHPTRESFRQFNNLDPQARLDEFHKRFDRLKSEFHNSPRQMFESSNRPFFGNHPSWTGSNDTAQHANGHVPVEKTIPIQVQHERSRSEPVDGGFNANPSTGNVPSDPRMHYMPDNSFYQHKFQNPFAAGNEGGATASEASGEPRVHHIPIQVESRSSSAGAQAAAAAASHGGQPSSQSAANLPSQQSAATSTSCSGEAKPAGAAARTIEIPIQITKSSSTPAPSNKVENAFQGKGTPIPNVNESASDPAIADPNKVYAMGYEPLASNSNQQAEKTMGATQGAPKKETPFDYVKEVLDDLKNYESQVHEFNGTTPEDKGYRFLDEMLTLCILRLDCINIDGNEELRKYRKSAINDVNRVAAILEAKVSKARAGEKGDSTQASTSQPASESENQNGGIVQQEQQQSQGSEPVATVTQQPEETASQPVEPKDKKEAKKLEKAKAKKEKEEKEKAKKESGEKKEGGRRIILFRGKNKNKANQNNGAASTASTSETAEAMDLDTNNNDLKDGTNPSTSDQNSETASTSSNSTTTLQGKETAV